MKKQVGLGLSLLLGIFAMTACAGNSAEAQGTQADTSAQAQTDTEAQTESGIKTADAQKTGVFNFDTKTVILNSGHEMPIMGLGTYSLTGETAVNSVVAELQSGGRLIDTAHIYGNEDMVGQGVRESGVPREEVFIETKLYPNQFSDAENAIDEALEKLGVDYIDLLLLHHPGAGDVEAYKAMEKAVSEGKIRSIGLSKMEYRFNCVSCI